jgi:LPXTG-motif cell wall-anchored protein
MMSKRNLNRSFKLLLSILIVLSSLGSIHLNTVFAELINNGIYGSDYQAIATSGGDKILIDNSINIELVDPTSIETAKVAVSNFKQGDELHFAEQNGITGFFDTNNGLLTLNGSANVENYEKALSSVEFSTISEDLESRKVTFTIESLQNNSEESQQIVTYSMDKVVSIIAKNIEMVELASTEPFKEKQATSQTSENMQADEDSVEATNIKTEAEESDASPSMPEIINPLINGGFEDGLTGWTKYSTVNVVEGGPYVTGGKRPGDPTYNWTINPYQSKMAVLVPSGSQGVYNTVISTLKLSEDSSNYIKGLFPNTTNFSYIYQDVELKANEELTMAWNYLAIDYEPFNDASFTSFVNINNPNSVPLVNGVKAQVGILGATVKGTGNYSTGSYGSTGWQTATFKAVDAGTYRLGFVIYNLDDTALSPYLFVDKEPGITLKNGEPFGPIPKDPNAPPPAGEVEPEIEQTFAPKEDTITANATDGIITVRNVPENTKVKVYKNGKEIVTEIKSGTVTLSNLTFSKEDTIQVTFTEDGKTESQKSTKIVQERSASLKEEDITANATSDKVTVKNVAAGATITIYNEDNEKIAEAINSTDSDELSILVDLGLDNEQKIFVTVTNNGDLESNPLKVNSSLEKSIAPRSEDIVVNATDKTITVNNVPENTIVKVYKDSVEVVFVEGKKGNITIPGIEVIKGEELHLTFTEKNKLESEETAKVAQVRSEEIDGKKVVANATTNTITIVDVPENASIVIYDSAEPAVVIGEANGDASGKVIITLQEDITVEGAISLTLTLPGELESGKTSIQPMEQSANLDIQNVSVSATSDKLFVQEVAKGSTIAVYNEAGEKIGEATNDSDSATLLEIELQSDLKNGQGVHITVTESGKLESEPIIAGASLDVSNAPEIEDIIVNATDKKVTVNNIPKNATVKLYKSGIEMPIQTLADATDTAVFENVELTEGEIIQVSFTLPNHFESVKVAKKAKLRSDVLGENQVQTLAPINVVQVSDVPAGASIFIYDKHGEILLGYGKNYSNETTHLEVIVFHQKLAENDSVLVTIQETEKLESESLTKNTIDVAKPVKERYENAGGLPTDPVYMDVVSKDFELLTLIGNPLAIDESKSTIKDLKQAIKALEEASAAKELENVIQAAEKAKEAAKKAETRYTTAGGEETAEEYEAVEKAFEDLEKALNTNPQDTKAIEAATTNLVEVTKVLEKASAAKELENAIQAAEKAEEAAKKAETRYTTAGGEETAEEYKAVEKALAKLDSALNANPQDTKAIEAATTKLIEATKAVEKASAAKELENVIQAAEKAKEAAKKAETRYTTAGGEETAEEYKAVEKALEDLEKVLNATPQNTKAIEEETTKLTKATKALEEASKAKELENAIQAAEKAKEAAEKAEKRYTNAGGMETAKEYEATEKTLEDLEKTLNANPQDTKAIEDATVKLVKVTKTLEEASAARELENAVKSAEKVKEAAKQAETRYTTAGGEKIAEEYKAVEKALAELESALNATPQDKKVIEEAITKLVEVTKALEEASQVKELENAINAAEKAKEAAKQTETRYTNADGKETAEEYKAVGKALEALEKALNVTPKNTKAIEEATTKLVQATKVLEEASKVKELENAIQAAEKAKEVAKQVKTRHTTAGGEETAKEYKTVEKSILELEKALKANPHDIKAMKEATIVLQDATDALNKVTNKLIKETIATQISSIRNMEDIRKIGKAIVESLLEVNEKKELYSLLVNKIMEQKNFIILETSDDISTIQNSIANSNLNDSAKDKAYIKIAEKAIDELAQRDKPFGDKEFQKEENQNIVNIINKIKSSKEKARLAKLHKLYVDTLSLTKEQAFTFNDKDSWESITSQFLLLAKGDYGSEIDWESSNLSVISINNQKASVNRQVKDNVMILTAKLNNGDTTLEKTFLLVVKSNIAGAKVTEDTRRQLSVAFGLKESTPISIQRINLYGLQSGSILNKIDKLIVDDSLIPNTTTESVTIYMPDDTNNLADELAIEVPYSTLQKLGDSLEVGTDQGKLLLSKEVIQQLRRDGIDLYFHIVPIRQKEAQADVMDRTMDSDKVKEAIAEVEGNKIQVLGTPREIETNYKGYKTDIILPLDDVLYNGIDLDMIRIYIEHTDGEKVVEQGEIIYDKNGNPTGIKFSVDKFSTFTIFEIQKIVDAPIQQPNEEDDLAEEPENSNPGDIKVEEPNNSSEDIVAEAPSNENSKGKPTTDQLEKVTIIKNKLPNTAGTSYNILLSGSMLLLAGLILLIMKRRKNKKA